MPRAAFVYTDAFTTYHLGDRHPLQQTRLRMTHRLLDAYGAFHSPSSSLVTPTPAAPDDLLRVHTPDYLHALRTLSRGEAVPDRARYGFGNGDTPPFPGMWEASLLYAGASLDCARLVWEGGYQAAFNTSGGLHHAQSNRAAGFCTVNDCALVAHWLLARGARRIAYVDIDAHHGDGVQALFYDDPRVLTLSIHESPLSLFPRKTGFAHEIGTGAGLGFNANLPLARATGDAVHAAAFEDAFLPLLRAFRPDAVLLQVGTDAHFSDRLAHLSLTSRGWLSAVHSVLNLGLPTIALGGGGYNLPTVARLWTLCYGALSGQDFPDAVPAPFAEDWQTAALRDRAAPLPLATPEEDNVRAYAAKSVRLVREHVFPFHGL